MKSNDSRSYCRDFGGNCKASMEEMKEWVNSFCVYWCNSSSFCVLSLVAKQNEYVFEKVCSPNSFIFNQTFIEQFSMPEQGGT